MKRTAILLLALTMLVGLSNVGTSHVCIEWHPCDCNQNDEPPHFHRCLISSGASDYRPAVYHAANDEVDPTRSIVLI